MYKATYNKIVRVKLTVNQSFKILRQNLASNNHLIQYYYGFKKRYAWINGKQFTHWGGGGDSLRDLTSDEF